MPDIHKLNPYKLNFINKKMKKISAELEFQFHDLLSIYLFLPLYFVKLQIYFLCEHGLFYCFQLLFLIFLHISTFQYHN